MQTQRILPRPMDPSRAHYPVAGLADPDPGLVADFLSARIARDKCRSIPDPLPEGIKVDLRPHLPKAMPRAMTLYLNRSQVDSFPLLYATVAFANPN